MPDRIHATKKRNSSDRSKQNIPDADVYRYMMEHIGDEVILISDSGKIVYVN